VRAIQAAGWQVHEAHVSAVIQGLNDRRLFLSEHCDLRNFEFPSARLGG
jgi:hypothetical protein